MVYGLFSVYYVVCGMFGVWDVLCVGCLVCRMYCVWDTWCVGCMVCWLCGMWCVGCVVCCGCVGGGLFGVWVVLCLVVWFGVVCFVVCAVWRVLCGIVSIMCRSELSTAEKYLFRLLVHHTSGILSRKYIHGPSRSQFNGGSMYKLLDIH